MSEKYFDAKFFEKFRRDLELEIATFSDEDAIRIINLWLKKFLAERAKKFLEQGKC